MFWKRQLNARIAVCCSFKKEIQGKGGVKAYRFGPDHRAFADPEHEPHNKCYCPSSYGGNSSTSSNSSSATSRPTVSVQSTNQCAPHGTFNVSLCQYGEYLDAHWKSPTFFRRVPVLDAILKSDFYFIYLFFLHRLAGVAVFPAFLHGRPEAEGSRSRNGRTRPGTTRVLSRRATRECGTTTDLQCLLVLDMMVLSSPDFGFECIIRIRRFNPFHPNLRFGLWFRKSGLSPRIRILDLI